MMDVSYFLQLLKKIAGIAIGFYGVFLLIIFMFVLFWDNKGIINFWEKSIGDWFFLLYVGVSATVVLYKAKTSRNVELGVSFNLFFWVLISSHLVFLIWEFLK